MLVARVHFTFFVKFRSKCRKIIDTNVCRTKPHLIASCCSIYQKKHFAIFVISIDFPRSRHKCLSHKPFYLVMSYQQKSFFVRFRSMCKIFFVDRNVCRMKPFHFVIYILFKSLSFFQFWFISLIIWTNMCVHFFHLLIGDPEANIGFIF